MHVEIPIPIHAGTPQTHEPHVCHDVANFSMITAPQVRNFMDARSLEGLSLGTLLLGLAGGLGICSNSHSDIESRLLVPMGSGGLQC